MTLSILMISAMLTAFSAPAFAFEKLTEDMVRQYYADNIAAMKKPYAEYKSFMDNSFHKNYASEQTVTLNLPGQPPAKNNVSQNKAQVMDFTEEAHEVVRKSEIKNEVREIRINADINSAHVVDYTEIQASLTSKDNIPLKMSTKATCNDVLTYEAGKLQMLKSKCEADTTIDPVKKLETNLEAPKGQ